MQNPVFTVELLLQEASLGVAITGKMWLSKHASDAQNEYYVTRWITATARWSVVQEDLIPGLGQEVEGLTPKLTKLIHTLEWARVEDFVPAWQGIGRPPQDRCALANGFVAKAVLGLTEVAPVV